MLDLFHEIWSTLRQNKLRTTLTGFAVSWGIFIIIVLLGTGNGLMNALLSNAGDEIMYVMRVFGGRTSIPYRVVGVTEADEMSMGHESYISYNVAKGMRAENAYLSFYDMIFHGLETKKQNEDFEAAYKRSFNLLHGTAPDDKRTTYIDNMFLGNQELEKAMRIIRHC